VGSGLGVGLSLAEVQFWICSGFVRSSGEEVEQGLGGSCGWESYFVDCVTKNKRKIGNFEIKKWATGAGWRRLGCNRGGVLMSADYC